MSDSAGVLVRHRKITDGFYLSTGVACLPQVAMSHAEFEAEFEIAMESLESAWPEIAAKCEMQYFRLVSGRIPCPNASNGEEV